MRNKKVVSLTQMAKRTRKGGYLSWNPMNWFKAAPETPVTDESSSSSISSPTGLNSAPNNTITDTSSSPSTSTPSSVGGRHTRRHRRGAKKTRSGKKSNRR